MVDLRKALPLGRVSGRNILLFAASLLVAFFGLALTAPTAHAADATWDGSAISYANKQFIRAGDATDNDPRNLPKGTVIYAYVEPITSSAANPTQKAHLIYFAPGTDPTKATTANYTVFDYTPPNTYANPTSSQAITLDAQANSETNGGTTSCALEGIGWIICPATNFLAGAMDWMFNILTGFLAVRPMQTTQDNALFRSWEVMRNFANVAFVIAFLLIIYSQLTSVGLSSYGIKKLLPRLIIAAILVNVSYWICAVAIDISNISGFSLQQMFINLRNSLVGTEGNGWTLVSWQSITGFILSGGTAAVLTGIGANVLLGGSVSGSSFFLVPILVIVLVSVLVAMLIMALRQALITILVIISPLAFVAYLLPNTEKYFDKWRDLFMTMLLMFPIMSVIFGGSQLAGTAIIQNANSINLILLGMAVQVAPLIITPLLLKFSGALLSRFGGMINNPSKGLIDRTRNWARDRAENQKQHVLAANPRPGVRGFATRRTQNIDAKRRKREGWKAANQTAADARWANSSDSSDIQQAMMRYNMAKTIGEDKAAARFENSKVTNANIQGLDIEARAAKLKIDVSKAKAEANWQEIKAGDIRSTVVPGGLAQQGLANYLHNRNAMAKSISRDALMEGVEKRRAHNAEHEEQQHFANAMLKSEILQKRAGGINRQGARSSVSSAVSAIRKAYNDSVNEAEQLNKHFNLSGSQLMELAMGSSTVHAVDSKGNTRSFTADDTFAREAAIEHILAKGSYEQIEKVIENSGGQLTEYRTTIRDAVANNKLKEKAVYLGGSTIDDIGQGNIFDAASLDTAVAKSISSGKIKAAQLATMEKEALDRIIRVAQTHSFVSDAHRQLLGDRAREALTGPTTKGLVGESKPFLEKINSLWP